MNHYLATHPDVKPRLLTKLEPWNVIAFERFTLLNFIYGKAHVPKAATASCKSRFAATGSKAWAIGPSKTKAGTTSCLPIRISLVRRGAILRGAFAQRRRVELLGIDIFRRTDSDDRA